MPGPLPTGREARDRKRPTLAGLLFWLPTRDLREELEDFRINYEAAHGETDLTRNYTSMWPTHKQEWLIKNHPTRYWDGLPPFVQAFFKERMQNVQQEGRLDDMPDEFLRLYSSGRMTVGDTGHSR